ncbi:hypothetical protein [Paraburkholderia rhizosphaerae]|uniref:hypothetical protein n=1 Tax=Paraburkholderia rhizosphaerae TaxID=480658 RepID=UPI0010657432|nr:hypothetical protein [Paraburkholderia rhizosphaerae]
MDRDSYLSDARGRARPDVFERIARLHASNAAAISQHRPRQLRTRIVYALATRGKSVTSNEQMVAHLRELTSGQIAINAFDDDHNSIVRVPSVQRVAKFLNGATANEPRLVRVK